MAKLLLKPFVAVAKTAVPVLGPTIGFVNAAVKISTVTGTGPYGSITLAIATIGVRSLLSLLQQEVHNTFACYVRGTVTCNPVWLGTETTILTSALH